MKYNLFNRGQCPHSRLEGIYGDEINFLGGKRLACLDCGRLLDGPVALAKARQYELQDVQEG